MIIKGQSDYYKLKAIQKALNEVATDEYFIPKLRTNDNVYINIPVNLLQIMREYFNGKVIEIKED